MQPHDPLSLADYRRRVQASYSEVRSAGDSTTAWETWRTARDHLFRSHAQSPLTVADRAKFAGLRYFPHDPALRIAAPLEPLDEKPVAVDHSGKGQTQFIPIGVVSLSALGIDESLTVFWLDAYGGGLFLPFRDATAGITTYGGGRYLLDTVKGADLGTAADHLVLDFNYSYHPSCVYSSAWSCPLAPETNRLSGAIEAGETMPKSIVGPHT